jgi:hypothetical protein
VSWVAFLGTKKENQAKKANILISRLIIDSYLLSTLNCEQKRDGKH